MNQVAVRVKAFLKQHQLATKRGLVAVSGGRDSVALFAAFLETVAERDLLTVVHLNHQLRGEESDQDEEFVRELARREKVRAFYHQVSVRELAQGENLEATARRLRYSFFVEKARESGATWMATGHHANDQAETVLHRMIRGTGLAGLAGIAPISQREEFLLIRPLLTTSREEIVAYLEEIGWSYREDATNTDTTLTRNHLRHEVIPLLEKSHPKVVPQLSRLAEMAHDFQEGEEYVVQMLLDRCQLPGAGGIIVLDTERFGEMPAYWRRAILRSVWQRADWPIGSLSVRHIQQLEAIALGESPAADFPEGVRASCAGRAFRLTRLISPPGGS